MVEPAEVLLIKDRYEMAFHVLTRGLAAEGAGQRVEALECYRRGRQHLTQGVEVPTNGERQQGPVWDTARQLQQRMRDTLKTVGTHLFDLETSPQTSAEQRAQLLRGLPPNLYPSLDPSSQPPHLHLYPTIPAVAQDAAPHKNTPPARPPPPASPRAARAAAETAAAPQAAAMANPGELPPAYTPQPTDGHRSLDYGPAGGSLGSGKQTGSIAGHGNELLFVPSGVQLFFVAPDGQVSSLSHPGYLRIFNLDQEQKDVAAGRPPTFLDVCDWLYPLTPDTPVLLANSGIFMFPDTAAQTPGSFVGIVLSSELPTADREMFQDLMLQLTEFRVQGLDGADSEVVSLSEKVPLGPLKDQTLGMKKKDKPIPGWSEKMGQGILTGATRLGQEVVKGAEATGRAIQRGASKIRDHLTPEETPSEVSPQVTKGLQAAKQATGGVMRVSQFLVDGVSTVAGHVAEKMAPHVKKAGAKLIPDSMKSKDGQPSNLDGAKFVAVSSLQGFSTVWTSLETGAKLVGKSVTSETVTTVTHKYGDDAGQATDTALRSVVNVGVTAYNIDNLGIKAILKNTGKKTAKAMFKGKEGQAEDSEDSETEQAEAQVMDKQKKEERKEEEKKE